MKNVMECARLVADQVGELPPIPLVVMRSLELLNDPSTTVKAIQKQITLDQALTAFILKIANSALYGLRSEVSTVSYAINLMGFNTTRSILMSYLARQCFQSRGSKVIQQVLWKHSLASAVFGRLLAEKCARVNGEEAFIACLLHDIGKGVLLMNRPAELEEIIALHSAEESAKKQLEIEYSRLGYSHVELGFLLMKKWRFAESIIESEVFHHSSQEYTGDNLMIPLVSLANKLSNRNEYCFFQVHDEIFEISHLGISEEELVKIEKNGLSMTRTYLEVLN